MLVVVMQRVTIRLPLRRRCGVVVHRGTLDRFLGSGEGGETGTQLRTSNILVPKADPPLAETSNIEHSTREEKSNREKR
jgi:hypothetical protein